MKRMIFAMCLSVSIGFFAACEPEYIVYEKPNEKTELGLPCIIDSECNTGRCLAGVCVYNQCETDEDCRDDEICNPLTHICELVDQYACGVGQRPIIQLDVTTVDFQVVTVGESAEEMVTINNIGDCILAVEQAQITSDSDPEFSCTNCGIELFPKRVPPGHTATIDIKFAPMLESDYDGQLSIRTDDVSLTDGIATVDLSGEGSGHPRLSIEPALINFGNVAINDPPATQTITVTNVGAGALEITRVLVDPPTMTSDMSVDPLISVTDAALVLGANEFQEFEVTYDPTGLEANAAVLYFFSNDTSRTCAMENPDPNLRTPGVGCVELSGDSRGPPLIQVSHTTIDFGQHNLGESDAEMVTISNNGQSDLDIVVSMTVLSSTDFRYNPPSLTVIPPGGTAFLNIFYEAAQLSQVTGTLQIQSNDPNNPLKNISLLGFGVSPYNNDVLKIEMTYENGDDGFFGNDFRDVNLYMESPFGQIVDKATPAPDWTNGGANDQQNFGNPQWSAIGVQEEPERVILFDAHEDAVGPFKACVNYREDCAMIPTDLLAGLLGIGVSALLTGLTEGIISPDSSDVADFIRNNCWDHESSRAMIATFVNGQQVAQHSVRMGSAGDYSCPVTIQRMNGLYCVSGASPPQPGCGP